MAKTKHCLGLQDLELIKEDGCYYLNATYILDTGSNIEKIIIDRILLPTNNYNFSTRHDHFGDLIDIGYGEVEFNHITRTILEEKIQEVTIKDIEERFGCKVKIVRDKND